MAELISVIIPTHNRAKLLQRAVRSVLNQTYSNFEILIINDGSSDNTNEVISNLEKKDKRIRSISILVSQGAPYARNIGLENANGRFITFLDDDDFFLGERLEILYKNYNESYSFICSNYVYQFKNFNQISKYNGVITCDELLYYNKAGNSIFTEKDKIIKINGYDRQLTACQDYDLNIRMVMEYGKAKMIKEPTYVVHSDIGRASITNNSKSFIGYYNFYLKYKDKFNSSQRKVQLMNILKRKGDKISYSLYCYLTSDFTYIRKLNLYLELYNPRLAYYFKLLKYLLRKLLKPKLNKYNYKYNL